MIRVLPLLREYPEAWARMPEALARIEKFCARYDTDTAPDVLAEAVRLHFLYDQPGPDRPLAGGVRVLVALDGETMIGHAVLSLENWCGRLHVTILQYELDRPIPTSLVRDAVEQIVAWARARGAVSLRLFARQDERGAARARLFRRWGFRPTWLRMDLPLEPEG